MLNKLKVIVVLGFLLFTVDSLDAQSDSSRTTAKPMANAKPLVSGTLRSRFYFMATDNNRQLTDYYANALGVGANLATQRYFGFALNAGAFVVQNLGSSDFTKIDSASLQPNRYEIGLFDVVHPSNNTNLRLEELNLSYETEWKSKTALKLDPFWSVQYKSTLGYQDINTDFINPQDGRMSPTFARGWLNNFTFGKIGGNNPWKFNVDWGYIDQILPRGTTQWYSVGNSIGLYGVGVNPLGKKSGYQGNIHSSAIYLATIGLSLGQFKVLYSNQTIENVNTTHSLNFRKRIYTFKGAYRQKVPKSFGYSHEVLIDFLGQLHYQKTLNQGGNDDVKFTYAQPNAESKVWSSRLSIEYRKLKGYKTNLDTNKFQKDLSIGKISCGIVRYDMYSLWAMTTTLNATQILPGGRFLMPREWGKDPFFTFMPRERNEGFANVKAYMINQQFSTSNGSISYGLGAFYLPSISDFASNKYLFPSYIQQNFECKWQLYQIKKQTQTKASLDLLALVVNKKAMDGTSLLPKYEINKVNLWQYNFMLNFQYFL